MLAHEELYQRAFVVSSFGKTYHVTGWKTGYVVAQPALTAELRKIHQYVNFCGVTPLQFALADFMAAHPEHVEELPAFYQAKRDLFCDLLAGSRFTFTRAPGTYFQLADYSAIRPDLDEQRANERTEEHVPARRMRRERCSDQHRHYRCRQRFRPRRENPVPHQGNRGNFLKSGFRFSTYAFLPSCASSER